MPKKYFIAVIIILIILIAGGFYYSFSSPQFGSEVAVYFSVKAGASAGQIAGRLKEQNLIKSVWLFKIWSRLSGAESRFVFGRHKIIVDSDLNQLIRQLTQINNLDDEQEITIIEGWRLNEMADYLAKEGLVSKEDFLTAAKVDNYRGQYDFLKDVKVETLEGFLFPDTYRIFNNAKADDIIKKMLDNFGRKFTPAMRQEIISQQRSIFEVVILASIIEREVLSDSDKKMVADIFLKRLKAGLGLQSDATINYITGKKTTRPSAADLQVDSLYNTYKYRGLPPGPISSPGLDSLNAAIYSSQNNYYYFLTDADGQAVFAPTYQDHLQNIKIYLDK